MKGKGALEKKTEEKADIVGKQIKGQPWRTARWSDWKASQRVVEGTDQPLVKKEEYQHILDKDELSQSGVKSDNE